MKLNKQKIRLPAHASPERYRIMIHPDLKHFTFSGEEVIFLRLASESKIIELHSKELKISSVMLSRADNKEKIKPKKIVFDVNREIVRFEFSAPLKRGKYELALKFSGLLADKLHGFYRSTYEHNGKTEYLATTQFESIFAREAFPCFDEPAHKAVFDVTLIVPKGLSAISNTLPVSVKEHSSGYEAISFAPTPKMSTYLLAFIVGNFEFIEDKTKRGVVVRIFATPGKKKQSEFALQVAIKSLEFYEKYFGIKYPLPVLDLIAIPDFSAGAMENWGAITYREIALLVDPAYASVAVKQRVALTIAHEIAHQWFGNLVTMHWWTDLWLNEGFASYAEYMAVDHIFPEWKMWKQFMISDFANAMELDALKNTHPIEVEVRHPREIDEIFDAVSYSKGASIIRMLADYIGDRAFQRGLQIYLKRHAYANASTKDLWRAFEQASGKKVSVIMNFWTKNPGYPYITAKKTGKSVQLSQSRFYSNSRNYKKQQNTSWPIPITVQSKNKINKFLFDRPKKTFPNTATGEWTKLNAGQTSFIRVLYDRDMAFKLQQAVKAGRLSELDRFGLVSDAFALCAAGKISAVEVLNLLKAYNNETDINVWAQIISGVSSLGNLFLDDRGYAKFRTFAAGLYGPLAKKAGWISKNKDSASQIMLRTMLLSAAAAYKEPSVVKTGLKLFKKVKSGYHADPNIRSVIYNIAAREGGPKEFEYFLHRYKHETNQEEKNRLARAMMLFNDKKLFKRFLELCMGKYVRTQDAPLYLAAALNTRKNKYIAYKFVKEYWGQISKQQGGAKHYVGRIVEAMQSFADNEILTDMRKFFKKANMPGIERTIMQTLETVQANIDWQRRDIKRIQEWLSREQA